MNGDLMTFAWVGERRVSVMTGEMNGWIQTTVAEMKGNHLSSLKGRVLFVGRTKEGRPVTEHTDMLIGLEKDGLGFLDHSRERLVYGTEVNSEGTMMGFYVKP